MSYPSTYSAWRRSEGTSHSKDARLTIERTYDEKLPETLEPHDVVIQIHAISLNYREIAMLNGTYPSPAENRGIPCSDAAAEVIAVGSAVSRYKIGDRVTPITCQGDFEPDDDGYKVNIGVDAPGVLREYAIFHEKHLVPLPEHLSWEEGSTLACAGVTAWAALDNMKYVPKNAAALLQGTGGVSMFALLLCLAAGIRPIITSSSNEKLEAIKKVSPEIRGLNYKTVKDQGVEIKRLTDGRGVDFVINNSGPKSFIEDISYLTERNGTVSCVGFLEGFDADWKPRDIMSIMTKRAKLKGISMGSKADFEEMNRFLTEKKIRLDPLLTERPFSFDMAKEAYDCLESGKFTGKIIIRVTG